MKPVKVARAPPNSDSRMRECTPSAPISTSPCTRSPSSSSSDHAVGVLFEVDAARADTHRIGRAFGQRLNQHLMKIAAMHQPVGRAVACDGIGAEVLNAPGLAGVEQPHLLGGRHRGDRLHCRLAGRVRAARASRSARSARRRRVRAVRPPARTARRQSRVAASASAATMPPMPAPAIRMRGLPKYPPLSDGVI